MESHRDVKLVQETQDGLLCFRLTAGTVTDDTMVMVYDKVRIAVDHYVRHGGTGVLFDVSKVEFRETDFLGALVFDLAKYGKDCRVAVNLGREPATAVDGLFRPLACFVNESEAVGYLRTDAPDAYLAGRDYLFWRVIGSEVGPERCNKEGCGRLRVRQSVFCKRHHYQIVKGQEYQGL